MSEKIAKQSTVPYRVQWIFHALSVESSESPCNGCPKFGCEELLKRTNQRFIEIGNIFGSFCGEDGWFFVV